MLKKSTDTNEVQQNAHTLNSSTAVEFVHHRHTYLQRHTNTHTHANCTHRHMHTNTYTHTHTLVKHKPEIAEAHVLLRLHTRERSPPSPDLHMLEQCTLKINQHPHSTSYAHAHRGASIPKQYLPLHGRALATYSLQTFANMPQVGEVIIVCDPSWKDIFDKVRGISSLFSVFTRAYIDSLASMER